MNARWVLCLLLLASPFAAQSEDTAAEDEPRHRFGFEVKGHWRDTDEARFPSPFPFALERDRWTGTRSQGR